MRQRLSDAQQNRAVSFFSQPHLHHQSLQEYGFWGLEMTMKGRIRNYILQLRFNADFELGNQLKTLLRLMAFCFQSGLG